ncbi:helix-turn-helix domain-containing protein [Acetobacter oeni]|uniref:Transcriptional regulator n=1 Tax=Acetobacter oeni TaxID=304077 RepID=A0A511XFX6_9PROT|nr:XRE family transcriptional regulator [Acetobacter oeni]MBB3882230.1 transcriptional regulator with XRE-family HTH domain [Acetobacter oeni]GBR01268.1 putative transcriptional regulator [Acetobacter oeni LMG 21952]GEN61850.1 transcriptional regulator [Acetobacter oeni]
MHNQPPKDGVLSHVGQNLRRLRKDAGLSQDSLAKASGLSRRTIVNLEGGDTNISLASLDRLAEALETSFVQLVADPLAEPRRIEALAWRGRDKDSEGILLGSVSAHREAQLWSWSLGKGDSYHPEPDPPGWKEMTFVTQGTLRIDLETESLTVTAGDFAIYSSAQNYSYANPGDSTVRFVRTTVE